MVSKTTSTKAVRRRLAGIGLVEAMIAIGITALLILVLTNVSMLSGRMFASFFNYVDLDDANRIAMDTMTRDVRECNRVVSCSATRLVIEDSDAFNVTYAFNAGAATLTRSKAGIELSSATGDAEVPRRDHHPDTRELEDPNMLRRRPIARVAVTTAVVAGTAARVGNRVDRRQDRRGN